MNKEQWFLCLAAVGLTPIALAYGLAPAVTVPALYNIEVDAVGTAHVFRAVMGLYFGMVVFWLLGIKQDALRSGALWSVAVFMLGLAAGRTVSLVLDGMPAPLLVLYLVLELGFGLVAVLLLRSRGRAGTSQG